MQQGELSIVCVGLSERDLLQWHDVTRKILGGTLGGQAKLGGAVAPPGTPPSSAPAFEARGLGAPESGVTAPLPLLKGGNGGGGAFSSHVVSCLSRSI